MTAHPTRDEDFDLYALGTLEGDELEAFESHIAACQPCAQKLAEARGRMALLALAVPQVSPSPGVKEGLMRQLSASAVGREYSLPEPEPSRPGFRGNWWAAIFAPAAAAMALATVLLWVTNNHLNSQIDRQRAEVQQLKQQADEINALLDLATARDTVSVPLAPMPEAHGATGRVLYNSRMGKMFYSDTMA
ncbi:MAG TPA: zf-HC2 domain-containing protein, partial [Candidatus Acidoferrales bacterium]|nr:zf-HC2 domain-containing protein [Candidatus Acidoferrales bacterium]